MIQDEVITVQVARMIEGSGIDFANLKRRIRYAVGGKTGAGVIFRCNGRDYRGSIEICVRNGGKGLLIQI